MDLPAIEAFLAIVELGGFTRAAEGLHLSQPALSRRIGMLEDTLGQPLFERAPREVRLTDAGRAFMPYAQSAIAALRDGRAAVRALASGETGTVTLAIVGTLASTGISAVLNRFRQSYPEVRVLLRTGNSSEVSGLVRRGEASLGLRYFADPGPDIVSQNIYKEPLAVVAAAGHRLAHSRRISPERLRSESWVAFPAGRLAGVDSLRQILNRLLAASGLEKSEVAVIDSLTAQKRLVEAGFGLALIPASSIGEELKLGTLRRLDVPSFRASADVALIRRKRGFMTPAVLSLIEALKKAGPQARRTIGPRQQPRAYPLKSKPR